MLLHVLQLHATVHGYVGDVRCPTKRHECARPSVWESRARSRQHHALLLRPALALLFPGANLPRHRRQSIDVYTGVEIVVPVRNFGPFSRTRTSQSPKSTYPDKQNRQNTANLEINILSRFSRRTIDVHTGATGIVPVREKHPFSQTRTVISVLVPTSND